MKTAVLLALAFAAGTASAPNAQASKDVVRIGFVTDLSGPYAALDGPAGAEAIRMAIADLGGSVAGRRVELIVADHQNRTDAAVARSRELFDDRRVDVLIGGVNSGPSLAMARVAAESRRPFIVVGAGNSAHTNEQCSAYTIQYAYDTVAQGKALGVGLTGAGAQSWFFAVPAYSFGVQMGDAASKAVQARGGTVVGSIRHAYGATDFSNVLEQAKASKAEVFAIASGHTDGMNLVKAARAGETERSSKLAGTFMFIDEIHELGLATAQGMVVVDSWFWSRDDESRTWSRRFFAKFGRMPSSLHAADYSAARQYLLSVQAVGNTEPEAVLTHLRSATLNDMYIKGGRIRGDGVMVHDMHLLRVKAPAATKEPWDYYDFVKTVPGDAVWTTKAESRCATWR